MHFPTQAEYEEQLAAEERQKLVSMVTALSKADREEVYRKGVELLEEQNSNESADCLPTVVISGVCACMCMTNIQYNYRSYRVTQFILDVRRTCTRLKIFAYMWFCCVSTVSEQSVSRNISSSYTLLSCTHMQMWTK